MEDSCVFWLSKYGKLERVEEFPIRAGSSAAFQLQIEGFEVNSYASLAAGNATPTVSETFKLLLIAVRGATKQCTQFHLIKRMWDGNVNFSLYCHSFRTPLVLLSTFHLDGDSP